MVGGQDSKAVMKLSFSVLKPFLALLSFFLNFFYILVFLIRENNLCQDLQFVLCLNWALHTLVLARRSCNKKVIICTHVENNIPLFKVMGKLIDLKKS